MWSSRRNYFANGPQAKQTGTNSPCPPLDWDELVLCLGGVSSQYKEVEWGCHLPWLPSPWGAWASDLGRGWGNSSPASTLPLGKQGTPPKVTWVAQQQQSHWYHSSPFLSHCWGRGRLQVKGKRLAPKFCAHCQSWSTQVPFSRARCPCSWWRRHLWNAE